MGTSKGYSMPTGGDWTDLKHEGSQFAQSGSNSAAAALLGHFIQVNRGAGGWTSGKQGGNGAGGSGGGGGATGSGSSARRTGRNLGGFLSRAGSSSLAAALEDLGLTNLVGQSAADISTTLLDALAGPASTLDSSAARVALAALVKELLGAAKSFSEVERALNQALDQLGVGRILTRFFALYVYECFCRSFYEAWRRKVGAQQAKNQIKAIKRCIDKSLQAKVGTQDPLRIRWDGPAGQRLTERILQETLDIFGGNA